MNGNLFAFRDDVFDYDTANDGAEDGVWGQKLNCTQWDETDGDEVLGRTDRRKKLKSQGIPPQPVLVVHEGKPTIITGFETTDPEAPVGLERAFWRQLSN